MPAPSPTPTTQVSLSDETERDVGESSPAGGAEDAMADRDTPDTDARPNCSSSLHLRDDAPSPPQREPPTAPPPPPPPPTPPTPPLPPNDVPPKAPHGASLIGLLVRGMEYQVSAASLSLQRSFAPMPIPLTPAAASGSYHEHRGFGGVGLERQPPGAADPAAISRRDRGYRDRGAESSGRRDERSARQRALRALLESALGTVSLSDVLDDDDDEDDDVLEGCFHRG